MSQPAAGVGLAVLPCFYVAPTDGLVRVAHRVDEHRLVVAVHAELRRVPRIDAVIDAIPAAQPAKPCAPFPP